MPSARVPSFSAVAACLLGLMASGPAFARPDPISCIRASFGTILATKRLARKNILPEEFIAKVERESGHPVQARMHYDLQLGERWGTVDLTVGKTKMVSFALRALPHEPDRIVIEDLWLQSPLSGRAGTTRNGLQEEDGLPVDALEHLKKQIQRALQEQGFKTIETSGASSYLVSILYRRLLGLRPKESSAETYRIADALFRYYRREAPEEFRVKDASEFSLLIGTHHQWLASPSQRTPTDSRAFLRQLDPERLLKNSAGERVGYLYFSKDGARRFAVPLDPRSGLPLRWVELHQIGALELEAPLGSTADSARRP